MEPEYYIDGQHNSGVFNSFNLNTYIYCYQNPVLYTDPNGKQNISKITMEVSNSRVNTLTRFSSTQVFISDLVNMSTPNNEGVSMTISKATYQYMKDGYNVKSVNEANYLKMDKEFTQYYYDIKSKNGSLSQMLDEIKDSNKIINKWTKTEVVDFKVENGKVIETPLFSINEPGSSSAVNLSDTPKEFRTELDNSLKDNFKTLGGQVTDLMKNHVMDSYKRGWNATGAPVQKVE
jgi:hypothetical protein